MNNEKFAQEIDELYARCKSGDLSDRQARFDEIEALTERYFAANGEMPDYRLLDRLATLCLREEMTDMNTYKMTHNEYPVMSGRQQERRQNGELSFTWAEEVAQDGHDYRPKTRDTNRKMHEVSGDY